MRMKPDVQKAVLAAAGRYIRKLLGELEPRIKAIEAQVFSGQRGAQATHQTREMLPVSAPRVRMRFNQALGKWEPAGYVTKDIRP